MRKVKTASIGLVLLLCGMYGCNTASAGWPLWQYFSDRFVQADGRVIDITFDQKSTSEGQAYGLFFALVANQRQQFDTILKWTSDNLADGQLGDKLPGWLWGRRNDGSWGIKDRNPASDADLWIAYSLLEAARIWNNPAYAETAHKLLRNIQRDETVATAGTGALLLPGHYGFKLANGRFRIVTSYMPGFLFRYLAAADPQGPWQAIWDNYVRMAPKIFSAGIAPDIFVVDADGTVMPDTEAPPSASYDAIRVYLWAGMSGARGRELIRLLPGYARLIRETGVPPEKVNPQNGIAVKSSYSPIGFAAAVLPYLAALDDKAALAKQLERLADVDNESPNYYDQSLILFGKGWMDGQYRFDDDGRLHTRWMQQPAQ
ncbi:MAG: cellulase [Gammaproteobacteria bacterium]|nr:cellulase [Gammaproteobacteria bacterium]